MNRGHRRVRCHLPQPQRPVRWIQGHSSWRCASRGVRGVQQPEVRHLDDGLDEPDGGGVADYDVACGLIVGEKFEAVADVHGYF